MWCLNGDFANRAYLSDVKVLDVFKERAKKEIDNIKKLKGK